MRTYAVCYELAADTVELPVARNGSRAKGVDRKQLEKLQKHFRFLVQKMLAKHELVYKVGFD